MKDIIITIAPFAQGFVVGTIGATIVNWAIVLVLMRYANKKKRPQSTILHGDARMN